MKTILTVDDSAVMRQMVRFTLESSGQYQCLEAEDGVDALNLLKEHTPQVIVSDINMPNMNGYELVEALRADERFKFIPIIMLTTEDNEAAKKRSKEAGATGWISKPFQPEKLLTLLKRFEVQPA